MADKIQSITRLNTGNKTVFLHINKSHAVFIPAASCVLVDVTKKEFIRKRKQSQDNEMIKEMRVTHFYPSHLMLTRPKELCLKLLFEAFS